MFCALCHGPNLIMKPRRLPNTVLSAPIHLRFGAFFVDYGLIGGVFWGIYLFLDRVPATYAGFRFAANSWPSLLAMWLYFAVMESSPLQATAGKLIFRLRVCDYGLERISFLRAVLRYLARAVLGVWLLVMLFTNSMQGVHDLLTKTLVLGKKDLASHRRNRERYRAIRASP
jgi:uncharacterized RDD family membrane protein YckC